MPHGLRIADVLLEEALVRLRNALEKRPRGGLVARLEPADHHGRLLLVLRLRTDARGLGRRSIEDTVGCLDAGGSSDWGTEQLRPSLRVVCR